MTSTLRRASRRGLALFSIAVSVGLATAARPAAPGLTYRLRMVMTPPDIPGMPMSEVVIVGRGSALGGLSRIDVDSVTGQAPLSVGSYMLTLDSAKMVTVDPSTKTYTEATSVVAIPAEMLANASISNVNVTSEKLGAGETMQGYATEKARLTTTYVMNIMGQSFNAMNVSELWLAKLPAAVSTPFDGNMPKELLEGPMKEVGEKMIAARKAFGASTAIKTVNTSTMSGAMMPQGLTTVMSVELLDIKAAEVDPVALKIPEGFTKK